MVGERIIILYNKEFFQVESVCDQINVVSILPDESSKANRIENSLLAFEEKITRSQLFDRTIFLLMPLLKKTPFKDIEADVQFLNYFQAITDIT